MAAEKSLAIVLRVTEFSETSCVVTLMTREFGKITAMAKGARRPKSPFEAAIDVLAICRIVFLLKSSGAMDLLTEAKLERRFRGATQDVNRAYAAYYVIELLRCLTIEHDPHPEVFDLAHDMICRIDEGDFDQRSIVAFELGLLSRLGHQPVFSSCAGCGRERDEQTRVSFSIDEGGVLCSRCRPGKRNVISISGEAWNFLETTSRRVAARSETKANKANNTNETEDSEKSNAKVTGQLDAGSRIEGFETIDVGKVNVGKVNVAKVNVAKVNVGKVNIDTLNVNEKNEQYESNAALPTGEIRQMMNKYISHLLAYPPRLQPYISSIK